MSFSQIRTDSNVLYGLAVNQDGTRIVYGNSSGSVSVYNGSSWANYSIAGSGIASCACSLDGTRMYAGAFNGAVFASSNGGATWSSVGSPSGSRAYVSCDGPGTRVCVTGGTQVFYADFTGWTNGASAPSFTSSLNVAGGNFLCSAIAKNTSGSSAVVVTANFSTNGRVYVSTDGGVTFTQLTNPSGSTAWYGCNVSADGNVVLGADFGGNKAAYGCLRSSGGGAGWTKLYQDPANRGFLNVATDTTGKLLVLGCDNNRVVYSSDLVNFTSQTITGAATSWVVDYAISSKVGYAIGSQKGIYSLAMTGTGTVFGPTLTVPDAPINVSATGDNGQAYVYFNAPASDGGAAITSYTATASPGGASASGASSPILVTGLTNGVEYTFTVTATNSVGTGSASIASGGVTPATFPDAPTNVVGTVGDGQVSVAFDAPANNGGSAITGYTVTVSPDGTTVSGASSPIIVTGLTNGSEYTFTVTATNSKGSSLASSTSAGAIPFTAPDAPQDVTVIFVGDGNATVSWLDPISNGGKLIDSYTVTSSSGGFTATGSSSPLTVMGLTNGSTYTFTVTAYNGLTSAASAPSASTTLPVAPGAPTGVTVTEASNGRAVVSWTAPASDGGAPILSYTVTSSPDGITATGSSSPLTVYGLTNDTAYTFTVTAFNGINSIASPPSASATPTLVAVNIQALAADNTIPAETVSLDARAYIQGLSGEEKASAKATYVESLRAKLGEAESFTVTSSNFSGFMSTLDSVSQNLIPKDVDVFVPTLVGSRYKINVDNIVTDGSVYTQFEMPINTPLDFYEGNQIVTTLYYTGSALFDYTGDIQGDEIALGQQVTFGTKNITMLGFGTIFGGPNVVEPTVEYMLSYFSTTAFDAKNNMVIDSIGNIYTTHETTSNNRWSGLVFNKLFSNGANQKTLFTTPALNKHVITNDSAGNIYVGCSPVIGSKFVVKYDNNGNLIWNRSFWQVDGSAAVDFIFSIAVDSNQNVYFVTTNSTTAPANGGTKVGGRDIVLVKLDSNGNFVWLIQNNTLSTTSSDFSPVVAVTPDNNVIVAYNTSGTMPGKTRTGELDTVIGKFSGANGAQMWIQQSNAFNSAGPNVPCKLCIGSDGNIVCLVQRGVWQRTTFTYINYIGCFKMDTNGNLIWNKALDLSVDTSLPSMTLDSQNNIYLGCTTSGTILGGARKGLNDIYVVKMDYNGNLLWAKQTLDMNTTGSDTNPSIAVDANFNIYVSYDTTGNIAAVGASTGGGSDIALLKLSLPAVAPSPPTNVTITSVDNQQAVVTWTTPTSNGGAPITGYTVTSSPGGLTASGASAPLTVTGLTNGVSYTFTVTATNGKVSSPSLASAPTVPFAAPGAPTSTQVSSVDNGQAIVAFTPPVSNGGRPVSSYTVTSSPGGFTATGTSSPITVTGLTNGTAYTFTVRANNGKLSSASSASSTVTPFTNPGAPSGPTVTSVDNGQAIVSFTPPGSNGGKAITSYTVTSSPDGITATGSSSPITVTGLTNGVEYTFTVKANNGKESSPSSASGAGTPFTNPGSPSTVTVDSVGNGEAIVSFATPGSNGGKPITSYTVTSSPGGITATGSSSPITVTGLTNGVAYTFTVKANNGKESSASSASAAHIPFTNPAAPTNVTVDLAANGRAVVSWTAPSSNGGKAISGYTVTSSPGGFTASGVSSPLTITGLDPATSYTFTVTASNGLSATSSPSSSTTPAPALTVTANGTPVPEISNYVALSPKTLPEIAVETRTLLKSLSGNTKKNEKVNYVQAFREKIATLENFTMPTDLFTSFINTLDTKTNETLTTKEILVFIPKVVSTRFTIYVDTVITDTTKYNHFEMPINEPVDFREGSNVVRTLYYTGTKLYDYAGDVQGAEIAIGQPITLGTKTTKLLGLGSILLGGAPAAGAAADPYVTAVNGITYKLPTTDAPIRLYQGVVDGKLLTVNATLRTEPATALTESNLRAYADLAGKMSKAESASLLRTILEERDTLCFFEKVYIEHGAKKLLVNLWEGKFDVLHKTGKFETHIITMPKLLEQSTKFYKNYKDTTMMVKAGEANIYLSLYDTPLIRNGVYIAAPDMETGNGVFVNTLSKKDMTLASLLSTDPVARRDAVKGRLVRERIADGDGTRIVNSVVYK